MAFYFYRRLSVVTNNIDRSGTNGSTANIDGTYILQNC
jgi:hypothetical protein